MIDPAVHVALLFLGDGALEPGAGLIILPGLRKAEPDRVEATPEAVVIDPAVHVALLGFGDGALVPGAGLIVLPDLRRQYPIVWRLVPRLS